MAQMIPKLNPHLQETLPAFLTKYSFLAVSVWIEPGACTPSFEVSASYHGDDAAINPHASGQRLQSHSRRRQKSYYMFRLHGFGMAKLYRDPEQPFPDPEALFSMKVGLCHLIQEAHR